MTRDFRSEKKEKNDESLRRDNDEKLGIWIKQSGGVQAKYTVWNKARWKGNKRNKWVNKE